MDMIYGNSYTKFVSDILVGETTTETITLSQSGNITCKTLFNEDVKISNNGDIYFVDTGITLYRDRIENDDGESRTYDQIIHPDELTYQSTDIVTQNTIFQSDF
jgi:hypothetical protein